MSEPQPLIEVERSGFVECVHHASVVVLAADGTTIVDVGATRVPIFPRSSNKPMQAVAALLAGASLDGAELALAAGSHAGEPAHLAGVRKILANAGLDESALRCPADLPADVAFDGEPRPVYMNCSGKHAGMLAACAAAGWETSTYLEPDHPLQLSIRSTVEECSGEDVAAIGVDGCGAPLLAISLTGLARAFRSVVTASPGTPQRQVADAMRAHPFYVAGTDRDDTVLMQALPGLLMKGGAEGVHAAALPDGSAVALKIEDGASRGRMPLMAAALARVGVDPAVFGDRAAPPVLGGGRVVGHTRARLP